MCNAQAGNLPKKWTPDHAAAAAAGSTSVSSEVAVVEETSELLNEGSETKMAKERERFKIWPGRFPGPVSGAQKRTKGSAGTRRAWRRMRMDVKGRAKVLEKS